MSQITAAWLKLPLAVRRFILDFAETFIGTVVVLNLVIPGTLDEAKAQALLVGGAAFSALVSALRRATPTILTYLRTVFPVTLLRVLLVALTVSALLVPAFAVSTAQAVPGCPLGYGYITLAEDGSGGGDQKDLCVTNDGNGYDLYYITHTQSGSCNALFKAHDDWNNCVSSIKVVFNDPPNRDRCLVLYDNRDYTGYLVRITSVQNYGWNNLTASSLNDKTSSIRFGILSPDRVVCDWTP